MLQEFSLEVEHIKGKDNKVADVLSRITDEGIEYDKMNTVKIFKNQLRLGFKQNELKTIFERLDIDQAQDENYGEIIRILIGEEDDEKKSKLGQVFKIHE